MTILIKIPQQQLSVKSHFKYTQKTEQQSPSQKHNKLKLRDDVTQQQYVSSVSGKF